MAVYHQACSVRVNHRHHAPEQPQRYWICSLRKLAFTHSLQCVSNRCVCRNIDIVLVAAAAGMCRSGAVLWAAVRSARESGALARLGRSQSYSLVANVFSSLFPDDYDRVSRCS
jgi:hypothetical protein